MITLIENGDVFAPRALARQSILLLNGRIEKIGDVRRRDVEALDVEWELIDATGCVVCPGLIDPHQHILGGSGERGFSSMTPEIFAEEVVRYGITTVVGCLGVDVTMKNMSGLIGKAKALREEGLDAYVWTGGYRVPPATLMDSAREDILFVDEVIGVGEVAISDERSMDPDPMELAKVVHEAYDGGLLAGKCGLTHFHVGDHDRRLAPLRDLIDNFAVEPDWIYVTHIERNESLMRDAIDLAGKGAHVDIDVVEEDLAKWLRFYLDNGGNTERLTISSDAGRNRPGTVYEQMRSAVRDHHYPLEMVLRLATINTASTLRLGRQGTIETGKDGHLLIMEHGSLDIVHVRARGGWMVRDGSLVTHSGWLDGNKREIHLVGTESGAK
jgi:beta-aspartyl-dipeptidase (metallo-type)